MHENEIVRGSEGGQGELWPGQQDAQIHLSKLDVMIEISKKDQRLLRKSIFQFPGIPDYANQT